MVNKNSSKVCRIACLSKGLDGSDESRHRDDDSGSFGMEDFLFFFFWNFSRDFMIELIEHAVFHVVFRS